MSYEVHLEPYNDLKRRVEITRDAIFQANLRLERRNKSSYLVISILSLFVIFLSLLPNVYKFSSAGSQALLALSIINSVFIIITTFLEASGNFVHRGEQLHRSARKVATVFYKLMLLGPGERAEKNKISELQKEYQEALDDCPFNHDNIDYRLVKITKPRLFGLSNFKGFWGGVYYYINFFLYKIVEFKWVMPHFAVIIGTLISLYYIIFLNYLGSVTFVSD